ncbi:MAG: Glucan-binding domain repeat-like protein [Lacrimispora sp.]|jgi:glucan-binding YG repeat protein|nr:Glucan-binding domain repeat-like protein [Lacrimispora sp.]
MTLKKNKRFLSSILVTAILMSAIPVNVYAETGQILSLGDQDAKSIAGWVGETDSTSGFDFSTVVPTANWYQNSNTDFVQYNSPTDSGDGTTDVIEYNPFYKTKNNIKGKIYKDYPLNIQGYYMLSASCEISMQDTKDIGKLNIEVYDNTAGIGDPINSISSASAEYKSGEWDTVLINNLYLTSRVKMIRVVLEALTDPIDENNYIDFDGFNVSLTQAAAPPIISNLDGDIVTFTEGSVPVKLDKDSNVTAKVDTDFGRTYAGGSVTASISSNGVVAEDVLELAQTDGIALSGDNAFYNGTSIGTYSGGTSGTNLSILLNSNANDTSVAALIKAITYKNTNTLKPDIKPRTVMVSAADNTNASEPVYTTVNVQSVNYAPVRKSSVEASASRSVPVRNPYHLNLSTIFDDPDTDPLTYKVKINTESEATALEDYYFTPPAAGTYTLMFTASDGAVDSTDTYIVTLTAVNTAPVRKSGVAESKSENATVGTEVIIDLNGIFEDADHDTLNYKVKINEQPESAISDKLTFIPDGVGTLTLVFKVNDGIADSEDTYTVILNVKAPNTPPARKSIVNENDTVSAAVNKAYSISLNTKFEDIDGDNLTYKVKINGGTEETANESYSYTPTVAGTDILVFRAYDGSATSTDTYTVTLTAVNTIPARISGVGESVSGNVVVNNTYALELSQIFEDENEDPLTYKVKVDDGAEQSIGKDYSFTPTVAGTYTLVFKANDGISDSTDIYTVTLNVKEPNRAPVRKSGVEESESITALVNSEFALILNNIFEDADSDPLTYKVKVDSEPEVAANKIYSYKVPTVGTHTLVFKANDGIVDSTETYTVIFIATENPVRSITPPDPVTGIVNGTAKTASALGLPANVSLVTDMGSLSANVTWDVAASSYDPDQKAKQTFEVEGTVSLPADVYNPDGISLDVTVNVTVEAEVLVDKVLESISSLPPIAGIDNGTAKTASALKLPENVILETDQGTVSASVTWDVAASSYDPDQKTEQNFEVEGTVSLPIKVINPNGISLNITVDVTVDAESPTDKILEKIDSLPSIKGITNGTAKTVTALGIPSKVTLGTDSGNVQADVVWDLDSSSYDPFISEEQTFTVDGTVVLPDNVVNPSGIPLEVTVNLTVLEEQEEQEYYTIRISVTKKPDKVSYTLGEDLDTQGLEVTEHQKASPSNAVRKTVLSEGQYDLEYNLTRTGTRTVKVIYYGTDRYGNEKEFTDEFTVRVKEPPRDDSDDSDDDREITEPGKRKGGDNDHYYSGNWQSDENGWKITGKDGSSPTNRWVYTDWKGSNDWYFFDEKGYMVTGWFEYKGNKYYLNPVSDGKKGYMYTGWNMIEGKWYYFSEAADDTKGSVLRDTQTPDGHRVGPDGERIS